MRVAAKRGLEYGDGGHRRPWSRGCVQCSLGVPATARRADNEIRAWFCSPAVCLGERDALESDLAPMDRDSVVSGKIVGVAEELAGTVRLAEPTLWSIAHIVLKG